MDRLQRDLVFAVRTLARTPVITGAALLSLALGIGANTTIFTLINAVFLRGPVHVEEPDRLVSVFFSEEGRGDEAVTNRFPFSRLNYLDLEEGSRDVFDGLVNVIGFGGAAMRVDGGEPEQVAGNLVSGNYFDVLGVRAAHGRTFLPYEDETPGTHPVVVLSHSFWERRFGGDPSIVGSTVLLNSEGFEVIGIAPEGFNGTFTLGSPSFWMPMAMHDVFLGGLMREWFDQRRPGQTNAFGRLREGITLEQASGAVARVGNALEELYPIDNKNRTFTLVPFKESMIAPQQRELFIRGGWMLMGVVGVVLLIACGNVANLLLAKASARRKEIAIRLSIGATRGELVRQLLTESLLLALAAGALGLLVAVWARSILWSMRPPFLDDSAMDLSFDPIVLGFTLLVSLVTGVLFGLIPAVRATRPELVTDLKDASVSKPGRRFELREALVAAQVALSFVALIGAGLFVRSLGAATEIDVGFEPEGLVAMNFDVGANGYEQPQGRAFFERVLERAAAVPGVERVGLATSVPMVSFDILRSVYGEGRTEDDERNGKYTLVSTVSPDYFRTAGIELLKGRTFNERDHADAPAVVVVSQAMADEQWPDEDPIGKRFHFHGQDDLEREVVGVVETSKFGSLGEPPQSVTYMPVEQNYRDVMTLVARGSSSGSGGDPEALLGTLRKEMQQLDPTLAITGVQIVEESVGQSLWTARMAAGLLGILGALALVLAAIGLYGVMSHAVGQRSRELGIRMAMGADRSELVGLVLKRGMILAGAGLLLGVGVALFLSRGLTTLLYGVSPSDFTTYLVTVGILLLVTLVANLLPARRATRIDPVKVLRAER